MPADTVVLGLGSNLEIPLDNLRRALAEIKKISEVEVKNVSSIYESDAQVPKNAPSTWNQKFLNAAVLIKVDSLAPIQLLHKLKQIEMKLGRDSAEVWAPRLIDIDILYWQGVSFTSVELSLPHARISERPFALLPLLDVLPQAEVVKPDWAPDWILEKPFSTKKSDRYFWPKLMGIVNLTDDSFSDGGQLTGEDSVAAKIAVLMESDVEILDFGAESTRPNAVPVDANSEFIKLQSALKILSEIDSKKTMQISIDTYKPEVLEKCLEKFKINYINDVSGLRNDRMQMLAKQSGLPVFVMHSLSVPAKKNESISEDKDPTEFLCTWWNEKVAELISKGLSKDQLIFDPGIGFGKNSAQCLHILKNLNKFGSIENEILVGHSRKSYQSLFSDRKASNRDLETALSTAQFNLAYVQYLRVHDPMTQAIALRYN